MIILIQPVGLNEGNLHVLYMVSLIYDKDKVIREQKTHKQRNADTMDPNNIICNCVNNLLTLFLIWDFLIYDTRSCAIHKKAFI